MGLTHAVGKVEIEPDVMDLRAILRANTRSEHDLLDTDIGKFDLADHGQYARFLSVQLAARRAIEPVLAQFGDQAPPSQAELLRQDLAALGNHQVAPIVPRLVLPHGSDAIGAFWAVAGSHLGNRAMLGQLARRVGSDWPTAFLADLRPIAYWRALLPRLARPALAGDPAIAAARAVFATFIQASAAGHSASRAIAA